MNSTGPKLPANLAIRLPADIAALLHRLAYETGQSKRDLVLNAIRGTYKQEESPEDRSR